jgi:hypothetical protein
MGDTTWPAPPKLAEQSIGPLLRLKPHKVVLAVRVSRDIFSDVLIRSEHAFVAIQVFHTKRLSTKRPWLWGK